MQEKLLVFIFLLKDCGLYERIWMSLREMEPLDTGSDHCMGRNATLEVFSALLKSDF